MADFSSIDTVRALTQNEVNKLNNAQLKKALLTSINTTTTKDEETSNSDLLNELKEIKGKLNEISTLKEEVRCLSEKLNTAYESIHQQQLFLEYLEGKDRRKNLVVYGLSESEDELGSTELDKLKNVLNKAKCPTIDSSNFKLRRLGNPNPRGRPLHITLNSQQQRDTILDTARELRNAGEIYSKIFINKDIHPVVRKEIGRLKKKAKEENSKSENSGIDVIYDPKKRVIKKGDMIIDRFTPMFF